MWPTIYEIQAQGQPIGLHTYGLFILTAFCCAFLYTHMRALQIGIHPDRLIGIYLAAGVGGIAGGRLLYAVAVDWERTVANPMSLFQPAGFAVYGGVIGGALAVGALAMVLKIRLWKLADIAGPAVLIGMGIGRMGCLSAGCCHGAIIPGFHSDYGLFPQAFQGGQIWLSTEFPFIATEFASGNGGVSRLTDIPLYPTQIWSILLLLSIAGVLAWRWNRRRFDGEIVAYALMAEPFYRIFVEAFRADHRGYALSWTVSESTAAWFPPGMTQAGEALGGMQMGLTTSQAIGVGSFFVGMGIFLLRRHAGVAPEERVRTADEDFDEEEEWEEELPTGA